MYGRRSVLLIMTVLFAGGAVFFVASRALTTLKERSDQAAQKEFSQANGGEKNTTYTPSSFNAFLKPFENYAPQPIYSDGNNKETGSSPQAGIPSAPQSLNALGASGATATQNQSSSPRLSFLETLPVPEVGINEIIIDPAGIKDAKEYGEFLATHSKEVKFPEEKMRAILKDDKGITLMPMKLVEKELADENPDQVKDSIPLLQEFVSARMQFGKSMKVTGNAIAIHQKMLGFDRLTIQLLNKAFQVAVGTLPKEELALFYQKYKNTVSFYNKEFYSQYEALTSEQNPWYAFLDVFGLRKIAHAFGLIVAGLIGTITPCTCNPSGYAFIVGPPLGGTFFITYAQLANPLYTAGVVNGAWILGFYTITSGGECLQIAVPSCIPVPYVLGSPTLAGTGFGF